MTIRSFADRDLESCTNLLIQAYKQPPWRYQWGFEQAKKYLTEYAEVKQFVGFLLCDEDKIVGALFGHTKTWWANNQLFIDELFVSPEKQRSGYGKLLLEHAAKFAKEQNLESISLMTNKFTPAFNFYKKMDYFQAEHLVFFFKQTK